MHPEWQEMHINGQDINNVLKLHAAEVALYLLPNGKRKGTHWVVGSIQNEPGESLKVCIEGVDVGLWHDFATGEGGNLLTLWMLTQNLTFRQALVDCAKYLGLTSMYKARSHKNIADEMYSKRRKN